MSLPAHVRGWSIPAGETGSGLTVVRAASPWGWHCEAGILNDAMTMIDPKFSRAWVVGSEDRSGITFLGFNTEGGWDTEYRATAALLHLCVAGDELGNRDTIVVPRSTVEKADPGSVIVLKNLGFSALYEDADLVARVAAVHEFTTGRFPEFGLAEPIPQMKSLLPLS